MAARHDSAIVFEPHPPMREWQAGLMFGLTVLFLLVLAVLLQWFNSTRLRVPESNAFVPIMATLWIPFVLEALIGLLVGKAHPGRFRRFLLVSLLPPFRLGYSTFHDGGLIWLPGIGWVRKNEALRHWIERKASTPMLAIALLILPLLGVEFLLKDEVAAYPWLGYGLEFGAGFIWLAFAFEFTLMLSITGEKMAYCRQHWINILIILLPLLAFLRNIQAIRALRAARSANLLRVYRVRGVLMRLRHALVALSAVERLLYRNPERLEKKLLQERSQLQHEIDALDSRLQQVQLDVAAYRARQQNTPRRRWLLWFRRQEPVD